METRAEAGTLTVMVGGDENAFAAVLPVLERVGSLVLHMGESGNGQLAKMTNNVLYNISCAAMAEMLPFAARLGLDPEKMRRVVGSGSGQSFGFDYFSERALKGVFDEGYPMGGRLQGHEDGDGERRRPCSCRCRSLPRRCRPTRRRWRAGSGRRARGR